MNAIDLLAYVREYAADIFVRINREGRWGNVAVSEMTSLEVIEVLEGWLLRGQRPVRLIRSTEAGS